LYLLLIALLATAAHGQFLPDADPDSLNMERVGQIRLRSAPGAEPFLAVTDLYLADDYAYLGSYDNLVYVVDIADPTDLREVARINTPGTALDIKVADGLAVIGVQDRESDFGLVVVDISDPTAPVELAQLVREG